MLRRLAVRLCLCLGAKALLELELGGSERPLLCTPRLRREG
jgi:hypothetical protein